MSSFSTKGKREKVRVDKRRTKRHMTAMYKILGEVKDLAKVIHNAGEDWTEENIVDIAANYTDLKIADMEKFLLLGNLSLLKSEDEAKSNNPE